MTRVARRQMLVVLARDWAGDVRDLASRRAAFVTAMRRCGCVHYAAVFGLRLDPSSSTNQPDTLAIELCVEEGLATREAMRQVVFHGMTVLPDLLGPSASFQAAVPERSELERARAMAKFMVDNAHPADGGHVGARDRSVERVQREAGLIEWARRTMRPRPSDDARTVAAHLRSALRCDPEQSWVYEPQPRSIWRASLGANVLRILGRLALIWLAAFALWWLFSHAAPRLWSWDPRPTWWMSWVEPAVWAVALIARSVRRLIEGVFIVALAFAALALAAFVFARAVRLFLAVAMRLAPPGGGWIRRVSARLDQPMTSPAATVAGCATGAALLAAISIVVAVPVLHAADAPWSHVLPALFAPDEGGPGRHVLPFVVVTLAILALATTSIALWLVPSVAVRLAGRTDWWRASTPLPAAQPANAERWADIERCELDLADRTMHMISLAEVRRPQWWFCIWLTLGLRAVAAISRYFNANGTLGDARGIHFAHWHVIDKRWLLFCANYDGAFGGYLDSFILGAARGVNLAWVFSQWRRPDDPSITRRFPPTRALLFRGCTNELAFKTYARDTMIPHQIRFEAYNGSMDDIDRASTLREALCQLPSSVSDDAISRALQS